MEDMELMERTLGNAVDEGAYERTAGNTVTVRDFMSFYLFPRPEGMHWHLYLKGVCPHVSLNLAYFLGPNLMEICCQLILVNFPMFSSDFGHFS